MDAVCGGKLVDFAETIVKATSQHVGTVAIGTGTAAMICYVGYVLDVRLGEKQVSFGSGMNFDPCPVEIVG